MDDKIDENSYQSEAYKNLYDALRSTVATCTFEKEPAFDGYYSKVYELYDKISNIQKNLKAGYENGKTCEQFVAEMRSALFGVGLAGGRRSDGNISEIYEDHRLQK